MPVEKFDLVISGSGSTAFAASQANASRSIRENHSLSDCFGNPADSRRAPSGSSLNSVLTSNPGYRPPSASETTWKSVPSGPAGLQKSTKFFEAVTPSKIEFGDVRRWQLTTRIPWLPSE